MGSQRVGYDLATEKQQIHESFDENFIIIREISSGSQRLKNKGEIISVLLEKRVPREKR